MQKSYSKFFILFLLTISLELFSKPERIIIFRHGEKLSKKKCGNLNATGIERSKMLAEFFKDKPAILNGKEPKAFFACEPRTIQTITPTAESFRLNKNIPFHHVNVFYQLSDIDPNRINEVTGFVARELLHNPHYDNEVVLICWEHKHIPMLAHALGALQAPDAWAKTTFNKFWILTYGQLDTEGPKGNMAKKDVVGFAIQNQPELPKSGLNVAQKELVASQKIT